jgi:hypothetical protein
MRTIRALAIPTLAAALLALSVGACGGKEEAGPPILLVRTPAGVSVLDDVTGTVGPAAATAVRSPDGRYLARADVLTAGTRLRLSDLGEDTDAWSVTLPGAYEPHAVSPAGDRVALTSSVAPPGQPLPAGLIAQPRSDTTVVVVHDGETERFDVDGNIVPEAFSADGTALFVVSYEPPASPDRYGIRRLDLETGELGFVDSPDGAGRHSMAGIARSQTWDPDGSRLYTLYTEASSENVIAFVHVLDLDGQWAHCLFLPSGFTPTAAGLALDADATTLYVADAVGGVVASIDTDALEVTRSAALPATPDATATPVAVDGAVWVATGGELVALDPATLAVRQQLHRGSDVIGLHPAGEDGELYVATASSIVRFDPAADEVRQRIPADQAVGPFLSLGSGGPSYVNFQCAC